MTDSQPAYDQIIIGGGHNGLVCGAYLAQSGRKVLILEASESTGGAACTAEFAPGYRASVAAHFLYALDKGIKKQLDLAAHGLKLAAQDLDTISLDPDGQHVAISTSGLAGVSASDQAAFKDYRRMMQRFAGIIGALNRKIPPRLGTTDKSDLLALASMAWNIRRLGKDDMREFLRIAGINIYDVLEERFENNLLKGALSLDGTLGTFLGARSNNSVFCALHRMSGGNRYDLPLGGMGAVSDAIATAAVKAGATIRASSRVQRVILDFDKACGVELENGEQIMAGQIISSTDPVTTFKRLLGMQHLEAGFAHRVKNIRNHGNVAKLHLALNGLPGFSGLDPASSGARLLIAPGMDYVERAFNSAKYGEYSNQPVMEISIPSVHDPALAPAGHHVLSAVVQWAPYQLKSGWDNESENYKELIINTIEQYAPGIRNQIVHSDLVLPHDLQARYGMTGGHWHHAELALDQSMMMRPVPTAAQYRTPVNGLWLCGAGSHPGGGVMGHAGRNAARAVIAEGKP